MIKSIIWFSEIKNDDFDLVGGRALSTAIMYNKGLPVPIGFVITSHTFLDFLDNPNIKYKISDLLNNLDIIDKDNLDLVSRSIRDIILDADFPIYLKNNILESYDNLNVDRAVSSVVGSDVISSFIKAGRDLPFVAVRESSAFNSGIQYNLERKEDSYFNVRGKDELINSIKKCWASLFSSDSINYMLNNKVGFEKFPIAIIIQKMVDAEKSGFIYSINGNEILIKAAFGLSNTIENNEVGFDTYILDKETLEIKNKDIGFQEHGIFRDRYTGRNVKNNFSDYNAGQQKINDNEIVKLGEYAKVLEDYYKNLVEIEWAIEKGRFYLLQSRPVVEALEESKKIHDENIKEEAVNNIEPNEIINDLIEVNFVEELKNLSCNINYHFIFSVQYKDKNILSKISIDFLKNILIDVSNRYDISFYLLAIDTDSMHLVLTSNPKYSPNQIINIIKDITTKKIFEEYPDIKDFLWGADFWKEETSIFTLSKVSDFNLNLTNSIKF